MAGEIGLAPSELLRMTPREFYAYVEGYDRRRQWARSVVAWGVHWLLHIGPWKKVPSPAEILGESREIPLQQLGSNSEEIWANVRKMRRKRG